MAEQPWLHHFEVFCPLESFQQPLGTSLLGEPTTGGAVATVGRCTGVWMGFLHSTCTARLLAYMQYVCNFACMHLYHFLLHEHWGIVCAWFEGWAEYWRKTGRDFPSVMIRLQKSKLSRAWNGTSQWPCGPLPPKALRSFNIQLGQEEMPDCWRPVVDLSMMDDGYAIWPPSSGIYLSSLTTVLLHAVLLRCCPISMNHDSLFMIRRTGVQRSAEEFFSEWRLTLKRDQTWKHGISISHTIHWYIIYLHYHKNQSFM